MDWFRFRVEGEVVINQLRRHYIGGRSRYNFNDMALRLWSDGQEQPEYGDHP